MSLRDQSVAAARQAADLALERGNFTRANLAFVFCSRYHADHAETIAHEIRDRLGVECLIGCTARGLIGGRVAAPAAAPAISILAADIPGLEFTEFTEDDLPAPPDQRADVLARLADAAALDSTARATFLFADPYSTPLVKLIPAFNTARAGRDIPLIGGLASAADGPGENRLLLNERTRRAGLVGVTIAGPITVETVVSQGCRPIGPELVITRAKGNLIQQLGGRSAAAVVRDVVEEFTDHERDMLEQGLFIGRVVTEYKDRHGPGDYLIRAVMGTDAESGSIAVSDLVRAGQTIRFHIRDARAATDDLDMLLAAHRLDPPPLGALLVSCTARGTNLFDTPSHDASAIAKLFDAPMSGPELAKAGHTIDAVTPPIAGLFAAGEIGPIAGQSYLHAHTACAALFRPAPNHAS